MKKQRRITFFAVIAACLLVFSFALVACGNRADDDPTDDPKPPTAKTYVVTFDANGGKFDDEDIALGDGITIDDGAVISADGSTMTVTTTAANFSEPIRIPELSRYAFCGWAKDKDGNELWDFDRDELNGDVTLYAVWSITFDFVLSDDRSYYIVRGIGGLSGDVEIPEIHNKKPVAEIAAEAFRSSSILTGIVVPDSVTVIGDGAFLNAKNLKNVVLGEGITEITYSLFDGCESLESLTIPKSVTAVREQAFGLLFTSNKTLTEVHYGGTIDDWCGIDMDCSSDYPLNPLCNGIARLYIDGKAVSSVTINAKRISNYAFYCCKTITSVTVGSKVEEIGEKAFYRSGVTSLDFDNAVALTTIEKEAFVTNLITELTLPDGLRSLGENAFEDCHALKSVDLGGIKVVGAQAFMNCFAIENLNLNKAESLGASAFTGNSVLAEDGFLESVTIPDTVWYIGSHCFSDQPALSSVTFESAAAWQVTTLKNNQQSTETVTTPLANAVVGASRIKEGGTWIRFAGTLTYSETSTAATVTGLESYDGIGALGIPSEYNGKPVTAIAANAFKDFAGLRTLTISSTVVELGAGFVDGCDGLDTIAVNSANTAYASANGILYKRNDAVIWVSPLVGATRNSGDLTIPDGVKIIPAGAFAGRNIRSVTIPESVTTIDAGAFENCPIELAEICAYAAPYIANSSLRTVDVIGGDEIADNAFEGCTALEDAYLPDGMTRIGSRAFANCINLATVFIPASVTNIASNAFDGCYGLTIKSFALQAESSWKYDGVPIVWDYNHNDIADDGYMYAIVDGVRYAFKDDEAIVARQLGSLTSISIPATVTYRSKTYTVAGIADGAFDGCANLTYISVGSALDYVSVNGILYNKAKTEIVLVPKGISGAVVLPSGVTAIGAGAFANCNGITSITLPASLKQIGAGAFDGCGFASVTIPASVTSIGAGAFSNSAVSIVYCESAKKQDGWSDKWNYLDADGNSTSIVIWDCKNNDKDDRGNMYVTEGGVLYTLRVDGYGRYLATVGEQSSGLRGEISVKGAVTYNGTSYTVTGIDTWAFYNSDHVTSLIIKEKMSLGNYLFSENSELESLSLPSTLTSLSHAFYACTALTSVTLPVSALNYLQTTTLQTVVINGGTSIPKEAFRSNRALTSITLGDTVTSIDQYAFRDCVNLTAIDLGNVNSIGIGAFYGCTNLTDADLSSVASIEQNAFYGCTALTFVTLGDAETSIGVGAFSNCVNLTAIDLSNVTSIGREAFYRCEKLIREENSVQYIGDWAIGGVSQTIDRLTLRDGTVGVAGAAFYRYYDLTSVELPDSLIYLNSSAFYECTALESVGLNEGLISLGSYAFYGCIALTSIDLPASLTSLGENAFSECTALSCINVSENSATFSSDSGILYDKAKTELIFVPRRVSGDIIIPDGVTDIRGYAFERCFYITSITIPKSVTVLENYAFNYCTQTLIIYCEAESKPDGWGTYWNKGVQNGAGSLNYYFTVVWDCKNNVD